MSADAAGRRVHTVRASLCRHLIPDLCTQPNSHGLVIFEGATSEDEPRASIDERGSPTGRGLFPATRTRRDASAWRTRIRGHCSGSPGLVRAVGRTGGDWGVRLLWPKQSDRESIAASGMPPSDVSTDPPRLANDRVYPRAGSEDRRDRVRPSEVFALEHGDVGRPLRSCADCRPRRRAWSTRCAWSIFVRSRSHLAGKRGRGQPVRSGRSSNWVVACRLINLNPW
jgi:hypothetical protein